MGYGIQREKPCPHCGATLELCDLYADPPPIPMRVASAIVVDDGRTTSECPHCDEEVDVDALLGNPPMPPRQPRPVKSPEMAEIDRELREIDARFNDPDPFIRYAEHQKWKGVR